MSHSLSWIDPGKLDTLLESAGCLAGSPTPAFRPRPTAAPRSPSRPLSSPSAVVAAAPYEPPRLPLDQRLEALIDWVEGLVRCDRLFVADSDGLTLIARDADPELVAIASTLINTFEELRRSTKEAGDGPITLELSRKKSLHVLRVETLWGLISLGMEVPKPLPRERLYEIRDALTQAVEEPDEAPEQEASEES